MSQLISSTWFSGDHSPVGPADAVKQVVRIENQFACECIVEIESRLVVDGEGTPVDSATLSYPEAHVSFRQTERVGGYRRKLSRKKGQAGNQAPNPLEMERVVEVGIPPAGQGRPYQVFGEVTVRTTESINGRPGENALWEDGLSSRDSILVS